MSADPGDRPGLGELYLNRRMAVLLGIGFASGLPYKLLGDSLTAWITDAGAELATIGLFSLVGLPLVFNFVWAPLLDRFPPPWLGRRRGWLLASQLALVAGLAAMALAGPHGGAGSLRALAVAALAVAFLSATLDVVSDAYRTDILEPPERGAGAAVFVNGYRLAMILAGGGALMLSAHLPWRTIYLLALPLLACGIVAVALAREPRQPADPPATLREAAVLPVADFWSRLGWGTVALLAFVVLFRLPDAMVLRMMFPFLRVELGFSPAEIAVARDWLGLGLSMVGALAGGWVVARLGMVLPLFVFGLLQAASNLGFTLLAVVEPHLALVVAVLAVENLCGGFALAAFVAFLMSQCSRRASATQYALFTSLMFGTVALGGALTGYLVEAVGFAAFFALTAAAGVPGLLVLVWLARRPGVRSA